MRRIFPRSREQTSKICSEIAAAALQSKKVQQNENGKLPEKAASPPEAVPGQLAKEEESSPTGKGKGSAAGKGQATA